jgi:peptide/nickel transport system substrate-binding protein
LHLKSLRLFLIIIIVVEFPLGTPHLAFSAGTIFSFQHQSSFMDDSRILHVLGEIKNESDKPMKNILISASFYDKAGKMLDVFRREPALQVINPGNSSPFEILYLNQTTVSRIANFTLSAEGQPTEVKETHLKIISANSRLDLLGTYYINALARNDGPQNATNAIVIATLFDKDGRVISLGKALAETNPGSSDIPPGAQAAFGVAITDKQQTYKTARYSLIVDSDNYLSDVLSLQVTGPSLSSSSGNNNNINNSTKSGCLIATAAFGSELVPQVQKLRSFRDGIVSQTFAGRNFMNVFNTWYYSFSPQVADYERGQLWLQRIVRASLYPLLGILDFSSFIFQKFAFDSELAIVLAGVTASALIGSIYFVPVSVTIGFVSRSKGWNLSMIKIPLIITASASVFAILIAELIISPEVMMFGTSVLVLSMIASSIVVIAKIIRW